MNMQALLRCIWASLIAASLGGCIEVVAREDAKSPDAIRADQVIVVGKIELVPPLRNKEQILSGKMLDAFKDRALLLMDKERYDMSDLPRHSNQAASSVRLGETFFLPIDRDENGISYFSGGMIVVDDYALASQKSFGFVGINAAARADHFDLAGKLKMHSKPTDRAIYIGTIRYHRDEFNAITRMEVLDEYAQAKAQMAKALKTDLRLERAQLTKW